MGPTSALSCGGAEGGESREGGISADLVDHLSHSPRPLDKEDLRQSGSRFDRPGRRNKEGGALWH
ncbi:hypothetical protein [Oryza sativa Japonica Group]|uniref:Uncharacterized protein n=1 Tax=Oryza sativa subsp. japonica TaxID=39947 RepID=Q5QM68_ORYSJ|nr:hypothetical protein [Oryza sativa Japonica Group]